MSPSLAAYEHQREGLLQQVARFGDRRPGSISAPKRRCGKPSCHCARPGDPGHQDNVQLTYKVAGKTVTQSLPTPAARRKAAGEIAQYRRFQQWSRRLVEVNQQICRLRPLDEEGEPRSPQEKKRQKRFSKRWRQR